MRIDDNHQAGIGAAAAGASQQVRAPGPAGADAAKPNATGDTGDAVHLSNIAGQVGGTPPASSAERSARVAELTKLVQSGQYNPNPEKIADSMINDMVSGSSPSSS